MELAAGADAELGEHLAQVILNGAGADEQAGADLRVGQAFPGQSRDLGLLSSQRLADLAWTRAGCLNSALTGSLSRGQQFTLGPFGELRHAHRVQHVVGCAHLLTRLGG